MNSCEICFSGGAALPLAHHHILQGMVYGIIERGGDSAFLHDEGYRSGNGRNFKLFCFSSLRGRKTVANGRINFEYRIYLDVRGVSDEFCSAFERGLEQCGNVKLGGCMLTVASWRNTDPPAFTSSMDIQMLSPLTVYATAEKKTFYFTPLEDHFQTAINQNFRNKYKAYYGAEPEGGIRLTPMRVGAHDKYVTRYKNTMITAWRGIYRLEGVPEHLRFLYYAGLGGKNSEGFGLWEPVDLTY